MEESNKGADIVILGAGKGKRMMSEVNKMFLPIRNVPLLYRTLYRFEISEYINRIVVVLRDEEQEEFNGILNKYGRMTKIVGIVNGGKERADSVRNGLRYLMDHFDTNIIMTHDGARPFVSEKLLKRLISGTNESGICIPVLKVAETVRLKGENNKTKVVNREKLRLTQTPQVFASKYIEECFFGKGVKELMLTDEASYFENKGFEVLMIPGEKWNIKVTNPEDILWSECLMTMNKDLDLTKIDG